MTPSLKYLKDTDAEFCARYDHHTEVDYLALKDQLTEKGFMRCFGTPPKLC